MPSKRLPQRVFLLSPARCGGERIALLLREAATFPLARELRSGRGAPLGDVFSFASGLYFRGKVTYARAFAMPPVGVGRALVITPGAGLVDADVRVRPGDLQAWAAVEIDLRNPGMPLHWRGTRARSPPAFARMRRRSCSGASPRASTRRRSSRLSDRGYSSPNHSSAGAT